MKFSQVTNESITLILGVSDIVKLDTTRYHFWLLTNNKLKWTIQHKEGVRRAEECEGTMSHAEYWGQKSEIISKDVKEYLNYLINN